MAHAHRLVRASHAAVVDAASTGGIVATGLLKDLHRPVTPDRDAPADPDLPLLERIGRGDESAYRELVDRHLGPLHAAAARLLGDAAEAEDVCQDVLLEAWKAAASWQPGRALFRTWMYRVAINGCHDRMRRRRPDDADALDVLVSDAPGPERSLGEQQRARAVAAAVQALPLRQREALVLCHYQGLTQAEAAAVLEVSVQALESLLSRARRQLREQLAIGDDGTGTGGSQ